MIVPRLKGWRACMDPVNSIFFSAMVEREWKLIWYLIFDFFARGSFASKFAETRNLLDIRGSIFFCCVKPKSCCESHFCLYYLAVICITGKNQFPYFFFFTPVFFSFFHGKKICFAGIIQQIFTLWTFFHSRAVFQFNRIINMVQFCSRWCRPIFTQEISFTGTFCFSTVKFLIVSRARFWFSRAYID